MNDTNFQLRALIQSEGRRLEWTPEQRKAFLLAHGIENLALASKEQLEAAIRSAEALP